RKIDKAYDTIDLQRFEGDGSQYLPLGHKLRTSYGYQERGSLEQIDEHGCGAGQRQSNGLWQHDARHRVCRAEANGLSSLALSLVYAANGSPEDFADIGAIECA